MVGARFTDQPELDNDRTFVVTVKEVNNPPVVDPIPSQEVEYGKPFRLGVVASDSDLPANQVRYEFVGAFPSGASLDAVTGELVWAPDETVQLGPHEFLLRVTDDGTPPREVTVKIRVTVFTWGLKATLARTLKGGGRSVSFSPDGKRFVSSGGSSSTVGVRDARTGQRMLAIKGHSYPVTSLSFSPDGKRIVSGSRGSTVKVWDAQTGEEMLTLKGHPGPVSSVSFSPDGKRIVSGGAGEIKVWDAQTGQEMLTLKGHSSFVYSVSFSPDGKRIVSGSLDKTLKVWDAQTGKVTLTLKGHSESVLSVSFNPDGKRIVSGSLDKTLKVWDAQTGQEMLTLKGHSDWVSSVSFSPDGKRIVSGSSDKTSKVWDAQTGQETLTLKGHSKSVLSVSFSPDGKRIVSGSSDNTLKVWHLETVRVIVPTPTATTPLLAVAPFDAARAGQYQQAWADHLGTPVETANSIGMKLRLIPAGEFMMGSPETESGRFDDETQHRVSITKPFYMGVTEVTQEQYQKVMGTNPSKFKRPQNPVETVSWTEAVEFCRKLRAMPAEKTKGYEYRLPTEAEWEYACRSGTTTAYGFGDDASRLGDYGWFDGNPGSKIAVIQRLAIHPVGEKKPNAWGLYDMHGNVIEWCQDRYGAYPSGSVTDPTGARSGSLRVYRGGSWFSFTRHCRSAYRGRITPKKYRAFNLGFRVLRSSIK
jgi:WD40 repeat protein